jgi:hypothetical protein
MKAVLDADEVLREVLNDLEEPPGSLFLLEQLTPKGFNLSPVEKPHGGGGHSHRQGHCSQDSSSFSDGDHFVVGLLRERLAGEWQLRVWIPFLASVQLWPQWWWWYRMASGPWLESVARNISP